MDTENTRLINIYDINVLVLENKSANLSLLEKELEENRLRVKQSFVWQGKEPDDISDLVVLSLILKFLVHAECFPQNDREKKQILLAISHCAGMLSKKARYKDESERFVGKYEREERSIWRDLIFMKRLEDYSISPTRIRRIFREDLKQLAAVVSDAIKAKPVKKDYQDSRLLSNIFEWVNYYREQESLEEILLLCAEEKLAAIDIGSDKGRWNILRILQIIGENVSKKNLMPSSRNLVRDLDFDLLVKVRNRLAHPEWNLPEVGFNLLPESDYAGLVEDIRFIRGRIELVYANHQACKKTKTATDPHSNRAVTEYARDVDLPQAFLSQETRRIISEKLQVLINAGHLTREACADFIVLLEQDINTVCSDIVENFKALVSHIGANPDLQLGSFISEIRTKLKKDKKEYEKVVEDSKKQADKEKAMFLGEINRLKELLPDDQGYKKGQAEEGLYDIAAIAGYMLGVLESIEKLLAELPDYAEFQNFITPFAARRCYSCISGLIHDFDDSRANTAHDLVRRHLGYTEGTVLPWGETPLEVYYYAAFPVELPNEEFAEITDYIRANKKEIKKELISYAVQIRMSDKLRKNIQLHLALEFLIASLVPFLRLAVVQKLPGFANPLKNLELQFYRNFLEHGDILEGINVFREEFLMRFVSILLKEIKPILEMIKLPLTSRVFTDKIYGSKLGITASDIVKLKPKKRNYQSNAWKTQSQILADYDMRIRDCGAGGDCLFRAVAAQIGENPDLGTSGNLEADHVLIRCFAAAALLSQREALVEISADMRIIPPDGRGELKVDFDTYVRMMDMRGVWGGQIEIFVLARLLNRPVVLFGENIRPQFFEEAATGEPIFLYYTGNHYQAVFPQEAQARTIFFRIREELQADYSVSTPLRSLSSRSLEGPCDFVP